MNIFRLAGDVSHLLAIVILLVKIWRSKSCAGRQYTHWHGPALWNLAEAAWSIAAYCTSSVCTACSCFKGGFCDVGSFWNWYFVGCCFVCLFFHVFFCIAQCIIVVQKKKSGSDVAMLAEQSNCLHHVWRLSLAMQTKVVIAIYPLLLMPNFECFTI